MRRRRAYLTAGMLAAAWLLSGCTDLRSCPETDDMSDGVRLTIPKVKERIVIQRTNEGLILMTRIAVPRPAEQPKQRLSYAGFLLVQERYEDGRVADFTTDVGPAFPTLPIPPGFHEFLGHATLAGKEFGTINQLINEGHYATVEIAGCAYETQVLKYYTAKTSITDGARHREGIVGRLYLSNELGFPLRWEYYSDTTLQKLIGTETMSNIERMSDIQGR